jgi:hypothetical protein
MRHQQIEAYARLKPFENPQREETPQSLIYQTKENQFGDILEVYSTRL